MSVADSIEVDGARDWAIDDVTPDELVARARSLAPLLIAEQEATEDRTYYSAEVHELFKKAGFYRILTPRRYGGFEFPPETFLRVVMELTASCGSTGWQYCLGHSHTVTAASFFAEETQREVFTDPDFICPTTAKPQGTATRLADGRWELSGVFNYCSGAPYASHFIGHTLPADGSQLPILFIAPRSQWTMLNDWGNQLGLKGTGSHSIRFDKAVLPGHYVLPGASLMHQDVSHGTVGSRLHGNPVYAGSSFSFFLLETGALATGIAKNGLAVFEEAMAKNTTFPPIVPRSQDPAFQRWYGIGRGNVVAAEELMLAAARRWLAMVERGNFTREDDMEVVALSRKAMELSWEAVSEVFFRVSGSSSVVDGTRAQRMWRDMSTLRSHSGIVYFMEMSLGEITRARYGLV